MFANPTRPCPAPRRLRPLAAPSLLSTLLLGLGGCFDPDHGRDDDGAQVDPLEDTEGTGTDGGDPPDSSGEAEEETGDGPDLAEACATYCSLIGDHCSTIPQYSGEIACQAVCEQLPLGNEGDQLGNSVTCRTHHTFLAAESPEPHCFHAGPTGDGTCGGRCESFCSLALSTCGDQGPFGNADDCIAQCESWNPEPRYTAEVGDADTYACRMRHLTLAVLDPAVHCDHIGTESPVCQEG